jgi:hypothetical protein
MIIEWVNHASFIVKTGEISLLSDPWIEGRVFNNSWDHISKSQFSYNDFKNVSHIWFSHEHPDHFFPPNLNKIPQDIRSNIVVLFQETIDKKVFDFCQKLGFKQVVELPLNCWFKITDDFQIFCDRVSNDTDSWLVIKHKNFTLLNLNDCVFNSFDELRSVQEKVGKLDVLFTQFSYANWVGNINDINSKKKQASEKLEEIKHQIEVFNPKYTIPFASYVWFCAEDNFHMNEYANSIDDVEVFISNNNSYPIVLYPGEKWSIGNFHDSKKSINKYLTDRLEIKNRFQTKFEKIPIEVLLKSATNFINRAFSENNKLKLLSYNPMKIFLTDYSEAFEFSFKKGLKKNIQLGYNDCDISFCSQNLKYCFDFKWGFDTIFVAGTFEKPEGGNFKNVLEYQWINNLNNKGKRMDGFFKRVLLRFLKNGTRK